MRTHDLRETKDIPFFGSWFHCIFAFLSPPPYMWSMREIFKCLFLISFPHPLSIWVVQRHYFFSCIFLIFLCALSWNSLTPPDEREEEKASAQRWREFPLSLESCWGATFIFLSVRLALSFCCPFLQVLRGGNDFDGKWTRDSQVVRVEWTIVSSLVALFTFFSLFRLPNISNVSRRGAHFCLCTWVFVLFSYSSRSWRFSFSPSSMYSFAETETSYSLNFCAPSLSFLLQLLYCLGDITNYETKRKRKREFHSLPLNIPASVFLYLWIVSRREAELRENSDETDKRKELTKWVRIEGDQETARVHAMEGQVAIPC